MVYEKSSFWIESDRTAPIAIKGAGGIREDKKYGRIVEYPDIGRLEGFRPFWIMPASFSKEINTDVELRKLIIKPPVFNILSYYKVEPDTTADQVYLEGYLKPTSYKVVDAGECYVYLNIRLRNYHLLGSEGRFFVTNKRKAVVSFEDFDEHGILIPAGSRLDIDIMVLDINAVRALKSVNSQNLMPPGLLVPKEVEEKVDANDSEYFKTPEIPNGFINTGSPTFLYPFLAKHYMGGIPFPFLGPGFMPPPGEEFDEQTYRLLEEAQNKKVNFGERIYPVDLVWLGFYRRRKKCIIAGV